MFAFLNRFRSSKSAESFPATRRRSARRAVQPRRLDLEHLEQRLVLSPISDKYALLGGPSGFLGQPTTPELAATDGIGHYENFQGGSIFWSPDSGAHEVHGAILGKFNSGGGLSVFGYPTTDESGTSYGVGRYNDFQLTVRFPLFIGFGLHKHLVIETFTYDSAIYWSPTSNGAHALQDSILSKFEATANETDAYGTVVQQILGCPTSDETDVPGVPGARMNTFEGGAIYWSPKSPDGAHVVYGAIAAEYAATANETDANGHIIQQVLGLPTSDEMDVPGVAGARMNAFQNGTIYWSPSSNGAHAIYGAIGDKYNSLGGPAGYGLPASDEADYLGAPGDRFTNFQNGGTIYWSANTGAYEAHGAINALYQNMAGPTSYLGMPTSDEQGTAGPRFNYFQNGKIVWTPQGGAYAVQATSQITENVTLATNDGSAIGGWAQLTVYADGSYNFVGHVHDSGGIDYDYTVVLGLVTPTGALYTFGHPGHVAGSVDNFLTGASQDDDWDISGSNGALASGWADLQGYRVCTQFTVSLDFGSVVNDLKVAAQDVASIAGAVEAVIILFA